jgi:hypothetical protein
MEGILMNHKDYKAIAAMMNIEVESFRAYMDKRDVNAGNVIDRVSNHLADYMAADNPRFDRDRFIQACYGEK